MTERNGRPGRRYDDMTQQNQSPVVTDEELIAALRKGRLSYTLPSGSIYEGPTIIERKAADRLEALTQPSGKVSAGLIEKLRVARDQWNEKQDKAAFENLGSVIDALVSLEAAQLPARPARLPLDDLFRDLDGRDTNQPGYQHTKGWNDAIMYCMDLQRALVPARPVVKPLRWTEYSEVFGARKVRGSGPFGEWCAFTIDHLTDKEIAEKKDTYQAGYDRTILSALEGEGE